MLAWTLPINSSPVLVFLPHKRPIAGQSGVLTRFCTQLSTPGDLIALRRNRTPGGNGPG